MKRMTALLTLFGYIGLCNVNAQTPLWKKGIVKEEFIYEKAPFPECHASTIAETPAGLVTAWFGGTEEGNPDVGIWVSRHVNGQWTAPVEVANGVQANGSRMPCWNPVLYQVPGGALLLFYKIGPRVPAWTGWMRTSTDNGLTWSAAKPLPPGFLGPIKNKPVLLDDGTLLCPSSTENDGWRVHMEKTADQGKTWEKTGPLNDKQFNAIQPSILFHKDGRLQALCRSKNRSIVQLWSSDKGRTWTPMDTTVLPNNNSGTDAVTLADGRQLLVYNHVKPPAGKGSGDRSPLNVAVSDDGLRWQATLVLENSPGDEYSYPAVIQGADGFVHIVYTWRRQKIRYVKVDPKELELREIKEGSWPR